ncbi:hypothetical protein RUND412_008878, partial [Rhizina undulata]
DEPSKNPKLPPPQSTIVSKEAVNKLKASTSSKLQISEGQEKHTTETWESENIDYEEDDEASDEDEMHNDADNEHQYMLSDDENNSILSKPEDKSKR